jgi:hypothetical protein
MNKKLLKELVKHPEADRSPGYVEETLESAGCTGQVLCILEHLGLKMVILIVQNALNVWRSKMVKVFPPIRDSRGNLVRGFRIFRFRKPGPTDLTWEEKNSTDYIYHPKDTSKLQGFVDRNKE